MAGSIRSRGKGTWELACELGRDPVTQKRLRRDLAWPAALSEFSPFSSLPLFGVHPSQCARTAIGPKRLHAVPKRDGITTVHLAGTRGSWRTRNDRESTRLVRSQRRD